MHNHGNKDKTEKNKSTTQTMNGQGIIEFALILGLILALFLGAVEIFNLLGQKADLDKMILQAARQAGEFGGAGDNNEVQAYIRTQMLAMNYSQATIDETLGSLMFAAKEYNESEIVDVTDSTGLDVGECKYGQLITVSTTVKWITNIPQFLFFDGLDGIGTFYIQSTARCWRAL